MTTIKGRWIGLLMAAAALLLATPESQASQGADSGITSTYAMGEVARIDPSGKQLIVRTQGGDVTVLLEDKTQYLRIPPGETKLDKAEPISLADIAVGDRVLARGKVSDDKKSVPARQLIVISKSAIAAKQEREREEWRRRGIGGTIAKIDPASREITITATTPQGPKAVVVSGGETVKFRRYAPDSVKFSDAKPSSFLELKAGDQLRALGETSADGARFQPEMIVSGSFVVAGGPITAVKVAAGEIIIDDVVTNKPLTVLVNKDSVLRRFPPPLALMLAQRIHGTAGAALSPEGGRQRQAGPSGPPARPAGSAEGSPRPIDSRAGAPGGDRFRAGGDINELLERLPGISLADLKRGEMILVSSTAGATPARVTAIVLAAGVEPILTQPAPASGAVNLAFPSGALDFGIGFP